VRHRLDQPTARDPDCGQLGVRWAPPADGEVLICRAQPRSELVLDMQRRASLGMARG
jgi:hypothetical protein